MASSSLLIYAPNAPMMPKPARNFLIAPLPSSSSSSGIVFKSVVSSMILFAQASSWLISFISLTFLYNLERIGITDSILGSIVS